MSFHGRRFCVALVLFLGLSGDAKAQPAAITSENLTEWLESVRGRYSVPSLGVAILVQGRVTIAATGRRKYDDPTPVTADDVYHLGSCTKSMTAVLLAYLVQDGLLSWESTLAQLFPELSEGMCPAYRAVTLRQLLEHRAGLSAETWPLELGDSFWRASPDSMTAQRLTYIKAILSEEPQSVPGSKFLYANRDYILAGAIAERVAGKSWETLMQERIFEPLHMSSAGFGTTSSKGKLNAVWSHYRREGKVVAASGIDADNPAMAAPAGTVHSTLDDWAKYILFVLQGAEGQDTTLSKTNFAAMLTPPHGADYAFGWKTVQCEWGGGTVLTHNGTNQGNFCVAWVAPKRDFAVLVVTNCGGGNKVCDEVVNTLVAQFAGKPPQRQ
ncbi:class A beta-lactamase-related serine hydrolase [bacterium]|nr:MAG: class A beta-lactamase-related serine hydrolase [bacterium]